MASGRDLAVDAGNSSVKLGYFSRGELIRTERWSYADLEAGCGPRAPWVADRVVVSSVGAFREGYLASLCVSDRVHFVGRGTRLPFPCAYSDLGQLGGDRLGAVLGAHFEFGGQHCVVVDAGSALTCEALHGTRGYLGGTISPGLSMRFRALHAGTSRLPASSCVGGEVPRLGVDTRGCIVSGCVLGIVSEIDTFALRVGRDYLDDDYHVLLTGGDAEFLRGYLPSGYIVRPHLVIQGLQRLLDIQ